LRKNGEFAESIDREFGDAGKTQQIATRGVHSATRNAADCLKL
jgi:hypothetical protein